MFSWDDILIVGDSFVADRTEASDWPMALSLKLVNEPHVIHRLPRGFGYRGGPWWSTRQNLLDELTKKIPSVLIIVHTASDRIPNDDGLGLHYNINLSDVVIKSNGNDCECISKDEFPEIFTATEFFFKYLISRDFYTWAQLQWWKELDEIVSAHEIQHVIHLHGFDHTNFPYAFKNGITLNCRLRDLVKEMSSENYRNHFTINQNLVLADFLFNLIMRQPEHGTIVDFSMPLN